MSGYTQFMFPLQSSSSYKTSRIVTKNGNWHDKLLGFLEYYDALLRKKDLVKRESEFRNNRLGLILALINIIDIPADLKLDLASATIKSWRLQIPEITLKQRRDELSSSMESIRIIKEHLGSIDRCPRRYDKSQLSIMILSNLPMNRHDFTSKEAPDIYDLFNRARDYLDG
jgi:hypothetical protein